MWIVHVRRENGDEARCILKKELVISCCEDEAKDPEEPEYLPVIVL